MSFNPMSWKASDLADRWLVDPVYKEGKHVIEWDKTNFTKDQILDKIRNLTTGRFFMSGRWIQFEDERDYIIFRLSV